MESVFCTPKDTRGDRIQLNHRTLATSDFRPGCDDRTRDAHSHGEQVSWPGQPRWNVLRASPAQEEKSIGTLQAISIGAQSQRSIESVSFNQSKVAHIWQKRGTKSMNNQEAKQFLKKTEWFMILNHRGHRSPYLI
jgi:hypothetical protein